MLSVAMRTSLDKPQAWVTEATLSTTTLRIPLTILNAFRAFTRAMVKYTGEGNNLREAEGIRGRPLAHGLAVHAFRCGHQRIGRLDALHKQTSRAEQHVH